MNMHIGKRTFRVECDPIEVTSWHRPDTNWLYVDKAGHRHVWHMDGKEANKYDPAKRYEVPSLKWVFERWGYYEDGSRYEIGHHECVQCGEHIEPAYTADTTKQYVPGMRRYYIDDKPVDPKTFQQEWEIERAKLGEQNGS